MLKYVEKQGLEDGFDKVCVVSIIGRSVLNCINSKANLMGNLIGQNAFLPQFTEKTTLYEDNVRHFEYSPSIDILINICFFIFLLQFAQIDGYYDANNRIVFLHLTSTLDAGSLTNLDKDIQKQFIEKVCYWFEFVYIL